MASFERRRARARAPLRCKGLVLFGLTQSHLVDRVPPIRPGFSVTVSGIYVALLQEAEGEGRGFAGGLGVALQHPWAGAAGASCSLLSPYLHPC